MREYPSKFTIRNQNKNHRGRKQLVLDLFQYLPRAVPNKSNAHSELAVGSDPRLKEVSG